MQRIDENTYIDDSLVTCAEYQLFIDEMHEQKKYYQPDHWTSNQFQKGQAREPILGVRYSDAIVFCEWLSRRDAGGWYYRLPNIIETIKYPLKPNRDQLALGYWVMSADNQNQFVWISHVPNNPRRIMGTDALAFAISFELKHDYPHARALDLELALFRYLQYFDLDFVIARDLDFAYDLDHARARVQNLDQVVTSSRVQAIDLALFNAHDRVSIHAGNNNHYDRDRALDLYIDLFTLQERIAGRSPAFEGIRLVKERIR